MGLLRKLLAETSRDRAEWIIWVDADTIIQARFKLPGKRGLHDVTTAILQLWRHRMHSSRMLLMYGPSHWCRA